MIVKWSSTQSIQELKPRMKVSTRGDKSICLLIADEARYKELITDNDAFRAYILEVRAKHPEILPQLLEKGFCFHDWVFSIKQQLPMRRIKLKENGEVYQLRPDFVMPYMVGKTDEIEKPMYLRQFGVPFEALAYVFGRNPMYWYRIYLSLGRASIVGTTIKDAQKLPEHLVVDEKHTWMCGKRVYVPTTAAKGCFLGVGLTESADSVALTQGYGEFQQEARLLDSNYTPVTVNTDAWDGTQQAWLALFPTITLVLCFLHDVLKVQKGCPNHRNERKKLKNQLWKAYKASNALGFLKGLRLTLIWVKKHIRKKRTLNKMRKLCRRAAQFKIAYLFPQAHRTSNMVDRLMNHQDRLLYTMQYFHGTKESARLYVRSMALVWNFHPIGARTRSSDSHRISPFNDLNGFQYHDNWLHNLLIASSMNGRRSLKIG